jgi:hypothetical protein
MGYKLGFFTGAVVGYAVGASATIEQRQAVRDAVHRVTDDPRVRRTRDAVRRNAGQVGDSVTDRLTDVVDRAGDAVDSVVAPDDGSVSGRHDTAVA